MDAKLDTDAFADFCEHLTRIILRGTADPDAALLSASEKMERASDYNRLTVIQKRLVRANILRKHRIDFTTQSRRDQLSKSRLQWSEAEYAGVSPPQAVTENIASSTTSIPRPGHEPDVSLSNSRPEIRNKDEPAPSAALMTVHTATDIDSSFDTNRVLASKAHSITTKLTRIGASQAYPPCPKVDKGMLVCPYCNDVLPPSFFENQQSWK